MRMYKVEEDPEKNGLHVPHFINKFDPVDEEEELYSVPWRNEYYIQQYPKLHRPSDKLVQLDFKYHMHVHVLIQITVGESLSKQFIRDSISMFEVGLLQ